MLSCMLYATQGLEISRLWPAPKIAHDTPLKFDVPGSGKLTILACRRRPNAA